ncbi:MAG: helix-turn-helix domain-containing protein [Acidimicrobiales bacterium]
MPKTEGWLRAAGNLLVLARLKAEISQSELAERAGVAQSAISAYERGVRQPTLPTLFRLLAAAGFDLRLRLAEPDNQERAAAEWERNQPAAERRRWAAEQRRVAGVPLER